jgi:hypothetical protein
LTDTEIACFSPVRLIEVGVFRGGGIGDFGADDVISPCYQIGGGKFPDHRIRLPDHILRQIVAAHLHGLHHVLGDGLPDFDGLGHPHDLRFSG